MLFVVCLLVLVEALAFVGLAVAWLVGLVRGRTEIPGAVVFLVVFSLGMAALLAACARGLWRGRRWARSPVILWQVLLVVLALGWLSSGVTPWGVAVVVLGLVVGIGLLLPSVVAATTGAPAAASVPPPAVQPRSAPARPAAGGSKGRKKGGSAGANR